MWRQREAHFYRFSPLILWSKLNFSPTEQWCISVSTVKQPTSRPVHKLHLRQEQLGPDLSRNDETKCEDRGDSEIHSTNFPCKYFSRQFTSIRLERDKTMKVDAVRSVISEWAYENRMTNSHNFLSHSNDNSCCLLCQLPGFCTRWLNIVGFLAKISIPKCCPVS